MLMRLHINESQRLRGSTQVYKSSRQLLGERMFFHGVAVCELCRGLQWQGFPELSPKVEFGFFLAKLPGLLCSAGYPNKLLVHLAGSSWTLFFSLSLLSLFGVSRNGLPRKSNVTHNSCLHPISLP